MPDASALWNLNRQLSFFAGALLLAQVLNLAQANAIGKALVSLADLLL